MLSEGRRPAGVARRIGVVAPESVAEAVVEVSVGTAELLFEGECRMLLGRGRVREASTVRLRVAKVTLCRSLLTLSMISQR
jgi:hypothetical protein